MFRSRPSWRSRGTLPITCTRTSWRSRGTQPITCTRTSLMHRRCVSVSLFAGLQASELCICRGHCISCLLRDRHYLCKLAEQLSLIFVKFMLSNLCHGFYRWCFFRHIRESLKRMLMPTILLEHAEETLATYTQLPTRLFHRMISKLGKIFGNSSRIGRIRKRPKFCARKRGSQL